MLSRPNFLPDPGVPGGINQGLTKLAKPFRPGYKVCAFPQKDQWLSAPFAGKSPTQAPARCECCSAPERKA